MRLKANLHDAENVAAGDNRDNRNQQAEDSAAAKSRMDFYFSPQHFPLVKIHLNRNIGADNNSLQNLRKK